MSLGAVLAGFAGGAVNAYAKKQQNEYEDAKLKAIVSGGEMPEKPKSLGSQLVDKVKEHLPSMGFDGNKSNYAKTSDVMTSSAVPAEVPKSSDEQYSEAFNDDSIVGNDPVAYQNVYGKGRV